MPLLLALLLGLRYRQVVTCLILFNNNLFMDFSIFGASTLFWNRRLIISWYQYVATLFCLVITMFVQTKIFFTLRHNQIHLQNHVVQAQSTSQVIPLNIARYRKAVNSALWVQVTLVVCHLLYGIVVALTPERETSLSSTYLARQFTIGLVYFNSLLNPLLYCWKIREVRQTVKETLRRIFSLPG